ncbi:hypothetical protein V6Z11_A12G276900 [Gossypium hirsutum]
MKIPMAYLRSVHKERRGYIDISWLFIATTKEKKYKVSAWFLLFLLCPSVACLLLQVRRQRGGGSWRVRRLLVAQLLLGLGFAANMV